MESRLSLLGRWPRLGEELRREKKMLAIRPEEWLHLIHGKETHVLVSFAVSNDFLHMGRMTIPVKKFSQPEVHKGDEVLYVLNGTLTIKTFEKAGESESLIQDVYEVSKGEKFVIPEGVKHQYFNFSEEIVNIIFAVAPEL